LASRTIVFDFGALGLDLFDPPVASPMPGYVIILFISAS